jgi:hypothetical protein
MAFTASFYGKVLDVIVQDSNDSQYLKGLSHNYLKVFLRVNSLKPEGVQRVKVRFVDIVGGYPLCVGV